MKWVECHYHKMVSKGNGAQNFAVLRHIALKLLRRKKTTKRSIHARRLKAGWDNAYWLKVPTSQLRLPEWPRSHILYDPAIVRANWNSSCLRAPILPSTVCSSHPSARGHHQKP